MVRPLVRPLAKQSIHRSAKGKGTPLKLKTLAPAEKASPKAAQRVVRPVGKAKKH